MLKRRGIADRSPPQNVCELGVIDAGGRRNKVGETTVRPGGEPWRLPVISRQGISVVARRLALRMHGRATAFTLSDYGYRVRVGKVVPTRERSCLHWEQGPGKLPLVWASDVRPDGTFRFGPNRGSPNPAWYAPALPANAYATHRDAVLLQRTSNRDQPRRLNAAVVPSSFLAFHQSTGFVAENHVIILEVVAIDGPLVSPKSLAALLNSFALSDRYSAVSGTYSVSARLLAELALPDPAFLLEPGPDFEVRIHRALEDLPDVLACSEYRRGGTDRCDDRPGMSPLNASRLERRVIG